MAAGYTVLATRYRPRTFTDVVGQEDSAQVLQRSIAKGRVPHAWLFSGPRGVGKTSMARILAKALDCLENDVGEPCGNCRVCRAIDETGNAMDVVEIDGASHNKVENVRDLIENLRFRPAESRYRIYIVDEVHMLSTSAFNALLKTLEEPPAHAKFILCTTEPLKVPETIRSRCQQFDFRRLTTGQIRDRLVWICEQEQVPVPAGLLEAVARDAMGGLRDALSLLDQLISFGDGKPTRADYERLTGRLSPDVLHGLVAACLQGDPTEALATAEEALHRGARAGDLLTQLTEVLEGVLVLAAGGRPGDRADEELQSLKALADATNLDHVVAMLDVMVEATRRLKQRHDARLVVEMAVLTLARLPFLQPVTELLAGGAGSASPAPRPGPSAAPIPRAASIPAAPKTPPPSKKAPRDSVPPSPSPSQSEDPARRLLEVLGKASRSLRMEISQYTEIVFQGNELLLTLPESGPAGLYSMDRESFTKAVEQAASSVAGQAMTLRMLTAGKGRTVGGKTPLTSSATRTSEAASGTSTGAEPRSPSQPAPQAKPESEAGSSPGRAGRKSDARRPSVEGDILDAWPGAERVDM